MHSPLAGRRDGRPARPGGPRREARGREGRGRAHPGVGHREGAAQPPAGASRRAPRGHGGSPARRGGGERDDHARGAARRRVLEDLRDGAPDAPVPPDGPRRPHGLRGCGESVALLRMGPRRRRRELPARDGKAREGRVRRLPTGLRLQRPRQVFGRTALRRHRRLDRRPSREVVREPVGVGFPAFLPYTTAIRGSDAPFDVIFVAGRFRIACLLEAHPFAGGLVFLFQAQRYLALHISRNQLATPRRALPHVQSS